MNALAEQTANPAHEVDTAPSGNRALALLSRIWHHRLGRISVLVLAALVATAFTAPLTAPYDPLAMDYDALLQAPSTAHWFGTDELGRDILSRVMYGATASLQVMGLSVAIALTAGVAIGLIAGYFRGWFDDVLMRIMDGLLAFPTMILALAIVAALGPDLVNAIIAIAIVNIPDFARLVRGQVISIRESEFIEAARAVGMSNARILRRHVWPSARGNVIVYASLKSSAALITESALSFLGLGVQPPAPTWGSMLSASLQYLDAWWMAIFPGLAIFITILALNFLGDALRDALDARIAER
jgi:peptide/nickel transport system permease protein